jgi:hypothetical protein
MLITAEDVLSTGGDNPKLAAAATPTQQANAAVLASRVSQLLAELGYEKRPAITDGLRDANAKYGAPKSAHKEGKAIDLRDRDGTLKAKITPELLKKHALRMEHPDATPTWCHLDTREPHGRIFRP